MRSIRISDETYDFLRHISQKERRSLTSTLDLFVHLFKETEDEEGSGLAQESIPFTNKGKAKPKKQTLVKVENENT